MKSFIENNLNIKFKKIETSSDKLISIGNILWFYFYVNLFLGFIFLIVAVISYYAAFEFTENNLFLTLGKNHFTDILKNLPAIGILIGGQIAGLSVFLNIRHSKKQKEEDKKDNEQKFLKVVSSYFQHLDGLLRAHIEGLKELKDNILQLNNLNKVKLPISIKNEIEQNKQEIEYIHSILNTMLNDSFIKDMNADDIQMLLNFKGRFTYAIYTLDKINQGLDSKESIENIISMINSAEKFSQACRKK